MHYKKREGDMSGIFRKPTHVMALIAATIGAATPNLTMPVIPRPFKKKRHCKSKRTPKHKPPGSKMAREAAEGRLGVRPTGPFGKSLKTLYRNKNLARLANKKQRRGKVSHDAVHDQRRAAA